MMNHGLHRVRSELWAGNYTSFVLALGSLLCFCESKRAFSLLLLHHQPHGCSVHFEARDM
jgi:hypothetical protein